MRKKHAQNNAIYDKTKSLNSIKELLQRNPSRGKSELLHHLERYPDDIHAQYVYGKICQSENNFEEAKIAYEKAANAENSGRIRYAGIVGLGEIARKKQDFASAKKFYWQAIKESPNEETYAIKALARLERIEGNYEEALAILDLIKKPPPEVEIEKLKIHNLQKNDHEAQELATRIKPESEYQVRLFNFEQAKTSFSNGDIESAKLYFTQAKETTERDPLYYRTLHEEARMLLEIGEFQATIDNCEEIYKTGENFCGNVNYIMGRANQALKKYQKALDNYRIAVQSVEMSPSTLAVVYYHLGFLELTMGDLSSAEKSLKANIDLTEKSSESSPGAAIDLLLSIYLMEERYEDAKKLIAKMRAKYKSAEDVAQLDLATLIIQKKTNQHIIPPHNLSYRDKQIINYKKSEAIAHIKNHHQGNASNTSSFPNYLDIGQLMEEIKIYLVEENRAYVDLMERYFIDYPNAGYSADGQIINRIGVVVIPGTKDILTMYPDADGTIVRKCDITRELESENIKKHSSIDKFNSRYAKFNAKKNA